MPDPFDDRTWNDYGWDDADIDTTCVVALLAEAAAEAVAELWGGEYDPEDFMTDDNSDSAAWGKDGWAVIDRLIRRGLLRREWYAYDAEMNAVTIAEESHA